MTRESVNHKKVALKPDWSEDTSKEGATSQSQKYIWPFIAFLTYNNQSDYLAFSRTRTEEGFISETQSNDCSIHTYIVFCKHRETEEGS